MYRTLFSPIRINSVEIRTGLLIRLWDCFILMTAS